MLRRLAGRLELLAAAPLLALGAWLPWRGGRSAAHVSLRALFATGHDAGFAHSLASALVACAVVAFAAAVSGIRLLGLITVVGGAVLVGAWFAWSGRPATHALEPGFWLTCCGLVFAAAGTLMLRRRGFLR